MVTKRIIAKVGTGLLAGFILFTNQSNSQELIAMANPPAQFYETFRAPESKADAPPEINTSLETSVMLSRREEPRFEAPGKLDKKSLEYNVLNQLQIKYENSFPNSMLSDMMAYNTPGNRASLYDMYTTRTKNLIKSSARDALKKWALGNIDLDGLKKLGKTFLSTKEESGVNVNYHPEDKGLSGQYLATLRKHNLSIDLLDVNPSISWVCQFNRDSIVNFRTSVGDGTQLTLRSRIADEIFGYASVKYGGLGVNNLDVKYENNMNLATGISSEKKVENKNGILETRSVWQAGASIGNSDLNGRGEIFAGASYTLNF
ncbi:MAG: hypothetical protein WCK29_03800 [archaeon]